MPTIAKKMTKRAEHWCLMQCTRAKVKGTQKSPPNNITYNYVKIFVLKLKKSVINYNPNNNILYCEKTDVGFPLPTDIPKYEN